MSNYTQETIKAMSTPDLVAAYNTLTGKSIKKFASRAAGERQVLKADGHEVPKASPRAVQRTKKRAARKVAENGELSAAITKSWKDPRVAKARAKRHGVMCEG